MKLHDLIPNKGKVRGRKRVGRGTGSGSGKTSGRGTKGQGARAGGGAGLYHQGGNLPFFRRLPFKRGPYSTRSTSTSFRTISKLARL
jgi:large subunit ribosomal protein L15